MYLVFQTEVTVKVENLFSGDFIIHKFHECQRGKKIGEESGITFEECEEKCKKDSNCGAFNFYNYPKDEHPDDCKLFLECLAYTEEEQWAWHPMEFHMAVLPGRLRPFTDGKYQIPKVSQF